MVRIQTGFGFENRMTLDIGCIPVWIRVTRGAISRRANIQPVLMTIHTAQIAVTTLEWEAGVFNLFSQKGDNCAIDTGQAELTGLAGLADVLIFRCGLGGEQSMDLAVQLSNQGQTVGGFQAGNHDIRSIHQGF